MKTRIYLMDTEPFRDEHIAALVYQALPPSRREKADRFRKPEDRQRSLAAGALLLKLCEDEGLCPSMPDLTENPYGKPFFSGHPEICFSLSHSGGKVILAVSDRAAGCDIETVDPRINTGAIAERFYAPEEYRLLQAEPDPALRTALFFRLWTLKESYVKASGLGMYLPFQNFCISVRDGLMPSVRQILPLPPEHAAAVSEDVSFFEYDAGAEYRCALCVANRRPAESGHAEPGPAELPEKPELIQVPPAFPEKPELIQVLPAFPESQS